MTSDTFAVERIEVRGQRRATEESIVRLSGVTTGQNVFELDTDEVARTIEAHPWVASATVQRQLPREVVVEVVEHEPVVLVALDHFYYANAAGEIVKRYAPGEREALPVVTGLTREGIETDDGESRALLLLALRFIADVDETLGAAAPTIAEVHVDAAAGLSFTQKKDGTRIEIGRPPWMDRIARIDRVKDALADRGARASQIMLGGPRRPDRAVARLAGEGE